MVHRVWAALPTSLRPIRTEVAGWLAPLSLTPQARSELVLATAANCIDHGYPSPGPDGTGPDGTVELSFWTEPTGVCIEVVDHGRWRPPPDVPNGRGYGLLLMRGLIETVVIEHDRHGTRVLLRQPLVGQVPTVS